MDDLEARAIRHLLHTDPGQFIGFAFRLLHPNREFLHNWSIDLLGEACARCFRGETHRLIVNMPPRSLKSICLSVAYPAWLLGVRPDLKVVCISGNRGLMRELHELTLRLVTHPKYRALFPHVRITERGDRLMTAQGGFRAAFTPSGGLTGHGADVIIIDDPQSAQDAVDPKKAEAIRQWYDASIYQRLDEKRSGVVILAMQRLAHDDLTAHLLKQRGWEHLVLRAIAMEDERLPMPLGGRVIRRKGEALHPARESVNQLREAMLRMGAKAFMSQYQQRPYNAGEGGERCGMFVEEPPANATDLERKFPRRFFDRIPEETFVLEELFGEATGLLKDSIPESTTEDWIEYAESMPPLPEDSEPREAEEARKALPHDKSHPSRPAETERPFGVRCAPCSDEDVQRKQNGW